jgi:hypothetical protein
MAHVVLLGDSIFDNKVYVGSGPDVVHQLRERLPNDWQATLLAVDGDTTQGVAAQLASLPRDATHLIVSAGGNDALMQAGILVQSVVSVAETMCRLSDVMSQFEASYRHMLDTLSKHHLPMAVCTIYDPRFDEPMQQKVAVAGLCHFNDVILRAAIARGLPVLDLRLICNEYSDYANEIEPGVPGGAKISDAVARLVTQHDFPQDALPFLYNRCSTPLQNAENSECHFPKIMKSASMPACSARLSVYTWAGPLNNGAMSASLKSWARSTTMFTKS